MNNSSSNQETTPDHDHDLDVDVDVDELRYLVSQHVGLAMDKFSALYTKAFGKLELAILEDLLPRLPNPMKGHLRVVRRVLRRLDKLRPFVVNAQRETIDDTQHTKDQKSDKKSHERKHRKQRKSADSGTDSRLLLASSSVMPPCGSCPEPLPLTNSIDRNRLKLIYRNHLFSRLPESVVTFASKRSDYFPLVVSTEQLAAPESLSHCHPMAAPELRSSEIRTLDEDLKRYKSFFAIPMNRRKFPAIWKYYYEQKLRKRDSKTRISPSEMRNWCLSG